MKRWTVQRRGPEDFKWSEEAKDWEEDEQGCPHVLTLETRDPEHRLEIVDLLRSEGFTVDVIS